MPDRTGAPFGRPGSVDAARMAKLPPAMQRDGALMLLDMGLSEAAAGRQLGLPASAFDRLVNIATPLFRRGGDMDFGGAS